MTTGALDANDPEYEAGNPVKPEYDSSDWEAVVPAPLRSAYLEVR